MRLRAARGRDRHIELQKQLLERERRIAELEAQLAAGVQQYAPVQSEDTSPQLKPVESAPEPELLQVSCTTWEQISALVGRNRSRLLGIVKHWSASELATLPPLLAKYLEEKPESFDETLNWTPFNLFKAALLHLRFTVQGIPGCRFVSLEYPQQDSEQWIFEDRKNRLMGACQLCKYRNT